MAELDRYSGIVMINCCVVIPSTIFPKQGKDKSILKSVYSGEERLIQTQKTVESLKALGYETIYLFDNSGKEHQELLEREFSDVLLKTFDHYQYDNKGISETLLLLEGIKYIPESCSIMKLSGRYQLLRRLELDTSKYDLAAKIYEHKSGVLFRKKTMATRCYLFKNRAIYELYLIQLLEEMYSYSARIVGFGSFKRFFFNQFIPAKNTYSYFHPALSVEAASIRVLKRLNLNLCKLDNIGLRGLAGTFDNHVIED